MWEKLIVTLFMAYMFYACAQVFRYFHLVWFRSDEYLRQVANPEFKQKKYLKPFSKFRNSPHLLTYARIIMTFILVLSMPFLFIGLPGLIMIWR